MPVRPCLPGANHYRLEAYCQAVVRFRTFGSLHRELLTSAAVIVGALSTVRARQVREVSP
jgi:hypothetical protein